MKKSKKTKHLSIFSKYKEQNHPGRINLTKDHKTYYGEEVYKQLKALLKAFEDQKNKELRK